ncbi:MAG: 3-dehydroquinate synthase [Candidatus Kentron sp. G]|nr:MAG: 3-dehydroquinate synthase [Candidatus Kentron sp. G]
MKESRPYYFGYKIEEHLIKKLREYEFDRLFFYTEKNLIESFGKPLFESIRAEYPCELTLLPSGEHCKQFPVLEKTLVDLTEKGASKKSMLIAFGGGTVGNLVGRV